MTSQSANRLFRRGRSAKLVIVLCSSLSLTGCVHAPSFNILGSYFPAWMLCVLIAIVLTVILRLLARHFAIEGRLEPLIVTYPCLAAFFSFTLWLLLFS